ncbi:MAG: glycosyltransferase [Chloroflexota bacterium]
MLTPVATVSKSLEDYRPIIGDDQTDEIYRLAEPFKGARILHINASAFGGGVAELLNAIVPLMNDVGLLAEWQVMRGADEFYRVSKALHNSLQGMPISWKPEMWEIWRRYNLLNAELLEGQYDYVIVHDPQPAGILHFLQEAGLCNRNTRWIWRCHIDSTDAQPEAWNYIKPYLEPYDAAVFTLKQFVKKDLAGPRIWVIPPAIDPLSEKNIPIAQETVQQVLSRFNVDPQRPLVVQASRMDAWKDPLGVLEAYLHVKCRVSGVQLVFLVAIADDDPEGWAYYEQAVEGAGGDPDVHILPNILNGIGDLEINAFQTGAQVVVQKSLREGFGLAVAEALWKARPVVGGRAGGIPLQIVHGKTGYLVRTPSECAKWILHLLQHPERAEQLGRQGREHVRRNFLITRYVKDYMGVFRGLERSERKLYVPSYLKAAAEPSVGS